MQYKILIRNPSESHFTASVLEFPACVAEGKTRAEALAGVKAQLVQSEIVTLDLANGEPLEGEIIPDHPWMKYAGMWADDPQMDEFIEVMKQFREEENREDFDATLDPGY